MAKRVFLFLAVNLAVMFTLMLVMNILGVGNYMTANGINYQQLAIFSLIWGMGGAIISLLISKKMAKWTMKVQIVEANTSNPYARNIYEKVSRLSKKAGLAKVPEVGIYDSPEVNAFATGATKNSSLVAVSTGLINHLDDNEVEAVIGHEIAHIANGDMVTMTLIQGVMNAFVIFFAKAIAWAVAQFMRGDEEESPSFFVAFAIEMVLHIIFGIIGAIIVNFFSRWREFRADRGGAELTGASNMAAALRRLKGTTELIDNRQESIAAFKISGGGKWLSLLSSHPPLDERIRRLEEYRVS